MEPEDHKIWKEELRGLSQRIVNGEYHGELKDEYSELAKKMNVDWYTDSFDPVHTKYVASVTQRIQTALDQHERDWVAKQAIEAARRSATASILATGAAIVATYSLVQKFCKIGLDSFLDCYIMKL